MWNGAFTEEHFTTCAMQSYPQMMYMLWTYNFLFSLTTAVLLLNMLIAMMGKTIDNVWEASSTHAQFLFARLTIASMMRPPEPPPLNLLRLPTYVITALVHTVACLFPERAKYGLLRGAGEATKMAFEYSTLLSAKSKRAVNVSRITGEYVGTSLRQRSTFEAWKAAWSYERLSSFVEAFIDARDDIVAQEGMSQSRHRSKLKKETSTLITQKLEAQQAALEATIEASNALVMQELRAMRDPNHEGTSASRGSMDLGPRRGSSLLTDIMGGRRGSCQHKRMSQQILETPGSVTGAVPQSFMTTGNVHGLMITAGHSCAMSQAGSGSNDGDSFLKWPGLEA